jgi:hypothetical protein
MINEICEFFQHVLLFIDFLNVFRALANSYKASFMQNLESIVNGINESLNKVGSFLVLLGV